MRAFGLISVLLAVGLIIWLAASQLSGNMAGSNDGTSYQEALDSAESAARQLGS